ncbi:hypothetical protein Leryth_013159 [Lithospermum erythrorhizon]|nr:hypothetical protein Leryth_013159 [Lithospermum erythrorhizon]
MAKGTRRRIGSRRCRVTPYPLPSTHSSMGMHAEDFPKITAKEDWEDATCSVCMEYPHNAVLLLCSSHDKGCRPYMCGTGFRYSNCLDQYKKAHTKCEVMELPCPLCRGHVKLILFLNRNGEGLSMVLEGGCDRKANKNLANARVVFGDYVIERNHGGFYSDEEDHFDAHATDRNEGLDRLESNFMNVFVTLKSLMGNIRHPRLHGRDRNGTQNGSTMGLTDASAIDEFHDSEIDSDTDDDGGGGDGNQGNAIADRLHREGRVFLGHGTRRRRRRAR